MEPVNESRYAQRLARYTTAMRNEQPDRVPIRPFVAEFTGGTRAIPARSWPTTIPRPSMPRAAAPPTSTGTPWCRT